MKTRFNNFLNEQKSQSFILSEIEDYGSFEGVVHSDIDRIKNWFISRKIDFNFYNSYIKIPIAFLNNINVDEEYRGSGYGNELYSLFEEQCYEHDVKCIFLECDITENQNEGFSLLKWYESFDFKVIGNNNGNPIMYKEL
jgi:ribosomal protein S18 acetylase RimI-like enzyme